ncbi:uncharacterized protein LOC113385849 [Ctenocephalides felis]|uniref:uncharacterized protein LOC113385849 n=1 Tax=Ctenocephalides felis TaxID=7515 RepID=UPI000E6E5BC4|nr:uncharacterized protein LOC113385849 [Ctenocephalides felis]
MCIKLSILLLSLVVLCLPRTCPAQAEQRTESHHRQKRLLWVTEDGRLALPPGTALVITPSLGLPFVRYPPDGFHSNLSISLPFTIDFDKLGLTDNENPYGVLPPVLARSMGRAAGSMLADYVGRYITHRRSRRSPPSLPEEIRHAFHGGERVILYAALEDLLSSFGMDGKACLLRAICEVHARPMKRLGLIGEMLRLFLSASKSPYSDYLQEYVEAESTGAGNQGQTECWPYYKACPKSLFWSSNKYTQEKDEKNHNDDDLNIEENVIPNIGNMEKRSSSINHKRKPSNSYM